MADGWNELLNCIVDVTNISNRVITVKKNDLTQLWQSEQNKTQKVKLLSQTYTQDFLSTSDKHMIINQPFGTCVATVHPVGRQP